ncbi:zinc finger protein [Trypanosoma melophagium]|uniref:zinc finger protein n=1 Tax=Trypanosoma melophagium TaxID=715481 RepID=UPI00351A8166|nr:zinc finger protein [Trypanosoma melophagium]
MGRNRKRDIVKSSKYKTSICSFYITPEGCPFGDHCAFAHGADELRSEIENTKILGSGGNLESVKEATGSDSVLDGCNATTKVIPLCCKGNDIDIGMNPESCFFLKDTVKCSNLEKTLRPESCENTEIPGGCPIKKENAQNEPVSVMEEGGVKCSKPPPKVTKRACVGQKRSTLKNYCNKTKTSEHNNSNKRVTSHNQCSQKCGFTRIMDIKKDLTQAFHSYSSPVPFPNSADMTHFGTSMGLHSGGLHLMCLSQCDLQMAGNSVVAPFAATSVVDTEGISSAPAHPFNNISTSYIPYSNSSYSADHNHISSNQIFSTLMPSSIPPMTTNVPFSAVPLHYSTIWSNLQNNPVLSPAINSLEVEGSTNHQFLHNHLSKVEAGHLPPAARETDNDGEQTVSQTSFEWDHFIRKWLDNQNEVVGTGFTEQQSPKSTHGKRFTGCCIPSEIQPDEDDLRAFDVLSFNGSPCQSADNGTSDELDRKSKEFEEAKSAREGLSPVIFNRNEGSLTNSEACSANGRLENVDEGEEGNTSSNTSEKSSNEAKNDVVLEKKKTCPGCEKCMPHLFKRRRPVLVNHFRSSCVAARRMVFLYCEECHTLRSLGNEREGALCSNSTNTPTELERSLEYCI